MKVVLDTSILRSDPSLKGGAFEALTRLAEAGYLEIVVPEIVVGEFRSFSSSQVDAADRFMKALAKLSQAFPSSVSHRFDDFKEGAENLIKNLESEVQGTFDAWMQRANCSTIKIDGDHARRVFLKYFDGALPFQTKKSRNDFPDAFIGEMVLDIAAKEELFFVAADKGVAGAFDGVANVTVFTDLKQLLASDQFIALRGKFELANNMAQIAQLIDANQGSFKDALLEGVANLVKFAYYKREEESLYVDVIEDLEEWSFDFEHAEYLGEGVISFSFEALVEASIDQPSGYGNLAHWDSSPSMGATLSIEGYCSLIIDSGDLVDPEACVPRSGWLERVRMEVDELHDVSVVSCDLHNKEW